MTSNRIPGLAALLKSAKSGLQSSIKNKTPLTIVIGNQSCDLDSFISSVLYSYFRSQKLGSQSSRQNIVPILNIPSEDLDIRPEFKEAMQYAGIDPRDMTTLDDLGPEDAYSRTLPAEMTRWILTDHNQLMGKLGKSYGSRVVGVIDHHEDEHSVPADTTPEPRVIELECGSCTSLVVREVRSAWDELRGGNAPALNVDDSAKMAKLAMASILVDTKNLCNPDKTRPVDVDAVNYLTARIAEAADGPDWNQTEFFTIIKDKKKDIDSIPIDGVFRKDYKEWEENGIKLGTSSSPKQLKKLAKKVCEEDQADENAWERAAQRFMNKKGIDLWLILTSYNEKTTEQKGRGKDEVRISDDKSEEDDDEKGRHVRELALHWNGSGLIDIARTFQHRHKDELKLSKSKIKGIPKDNRDDGRRTWLQENSKASRKQIAPMLRKVIQGYAGASDANSVEAKNS